MANVITKETYISIGLAIAVAAMVVHIEVSISTMRSQIVSIEKQLQKSEQTYLRKDEALLRLDAISNSITRLEQMIQKQQK